MQLTLFIFYLTQYFYFLLQLLLILIIWVPYVCYSRAAFTILINYLKVYTPLFGLISFILINLAGLPPVLAFFIKFNFIGYLFQHFSLLTNFFIFLIFFFNIIFYLYPLKFKNLNFTIVTKLKLTNYKIISHQIYLHPTSKYFLYYFLYYLQVTQSQQYNMLFWFIFFNLLSVLSIFFFFDLYIIFYNFLIV